MSVEPTIESFSFSRKRAAHHVPTRSHFSSRSEDSAREQFRQMISSHDIRQVCFYIFIQKNNRLERLQN